MVEHLLRQSIAYQMMEVLEQPGDTSEGIDLQTVQVILERIERTHPALEENCVRLLLQTGQ